MKAHKIVQFLQKMSNDWLRAPAFPLPSSSSSLLFCFVLSTSTKVSSYKNHSENNKTSLVSCCWRNTQAVIIYHWHLSFSSDEATTACLLFTLSFNLSTSPFPLVVWCHCLIYSNAPGEQYPARKKGKGQCILNVKPGLHHDERRKAQVQAQKWLKKIKLRNQGKRSQWWKIRGLCPWL